MLLQSSSKGGRNLLPGGGGDVAGASGSNYIVDVSPLEEEEIIAKVMDETNMDYATDGLLSPQSFFEEKRRLVASLESCLSQPSETWLTKDVVAQAVGSGISLDGTVLREVIATMVTLRDQLQREIEGLNVSLKLRPNGNFDKAESLMSSNHGFDDTISTSIHKFDSVTSTPNKVNSSKELAILQSNLIKEVTNIYKLLKYLYTIIYVFCIIFYSNIVCNNFKRSILICLVYLLSRK